MAKDESCGEAAKDGPPPSHSPSQKPRVHRNTWRNFHETGLLWWVNRTLHLFGWAIVLVQEKDGSILDAYPARVSWRGFSEKDEEDGFRKVSGYLRANAEMLEKEVEE